MTTAHFLAGLSINTKFVLRRYIKEGHLDTPAHAGYSMTLWVITAILGLPKRSPFMLKRFLPQDCIEV